MNLSYSKELVKRNKVKQISETLFEVENHSVKFQKKKGRILLICDCVNHTRFCNQSPICKHKISVIIYLNDLNFNKRIDKLINEYKNYKELNLPVSVDLFINDLTTIKMLK